MAKGLSWAACVILALRLPLPSWLHFSEMFVPNELQFGGLVQCVMIVGCEWPHQQVFSCCVCWKVCAAW